MSKQLRIWLFVLLGTLLTSTSLPAEGVITMTTSKSVGVSLYIGIEANGNVSIEGVKESARTDGVQHFYTLTNQKIVIRGDVTQLNCYWNQLTSLDVSGCIALTKLDCSRNELTSLDVSGCTSLTTLICRDNQLTSLDVSGCTALTKLECWQNKLTSLNVSGCTALTQLLCETNNLSSLYVSSCTSLTELNCWQNELTSLDVSKNTSLTELQCSRNKLTSLDLSKNTSLTELQCSSNQLTSLDVSKNPALTKLYCSSNQLTSLDVSKNPALTKLYCGNNQLTSLDVSKNTALTKLWCYNNQLTSLDVSKNTALTDLDCSDNQLTSLDVSKNISLTKLECYKNRLKGEAMVLMVAGLFDRSGEEPGSLSIVCDEAEENNILRSEILTASGKNWRVFKYIVRTRKSVLYSGDGDGEIVMTTTQEQSLAGSIRLAILADGDVTIEGVKERKFFTDGSEHTYTLAGTQITIRGNVSELDCSKNQLTNIDVSKSTSLWTLKCSDNKLTSLNASGCSLLTKLDCSKNPLTSINLNGTLLEKFLWREGSLTSLDVSGCVSLTKLDCRNNQLTSLKVSGCTALTELYCYSNQINGEAMTKLVNSLPDRKGMSSGTLQVVEYSSYKKDQNRCSFADVATASEKNWEVLKHVRDESNWESYLGIGEGVITMTTSKAIGEEIKLRIEANGDVLIEGVSEMPYLSERYSKTYTLSCQTITIRGDVTSIDCYNNRLVSLNVSGCTALTELNCNNNYLTSLDVSGCTALTTLYCSDNRLTNLDVSGCTSLTELSCNTLISLNASGCTALTELDCSKNSLTSLNLSNCTSLKKFTWYDGQLTSLDMSGCTALTELYCRSNQLTSLNVSGCTALTELYCRSNQLTSLDVSSCTSLTKFICRGNQLTSLDVSSCTSLTELSCWDNQLTSLDVSKNTALTKLDCKANQLTSLDMSGCTALTKLYCGSNQLTSLDVSKNTALAELDCSDNRLTSLDVSKNTALRYLYCKANQLTSLDVLNCTALLYLYCSDNRLTSLNISNCTDLKTLYCFANQIKGKAMTQLVADLPTVTGEYGGSFCVVCNLAQEGNVCSATNVTKAREKGWKVTKMIDQGKEKDPIYIDYEGEDETQEVGHGVIKIKTTREFGETIALTIKANGRVTIDGVRPFLHPDGYIAHYTLTSQTIIIRGDVTKFSCEDNQLINLDVSGCPSLTELDCSSNQLTSLNVSGCTALTRLGCSNNKLTSLDLSAYTSLTSVSCSNNQLSSLNLSSCTSLTWLDCSDNPLISIDLSNCKLLKKFSWTNRGLNRLSVLGCSSLTDLDCSNNLLTSLDLSGCTALTYIDCHLNFIKGEAMTQLLRSLPNRKGQKRGELYILYDGAKEENGPLLRPDAFAAINKNWALGKGSGRNWQYYTGADANTIVMTTTQEQLRKGFITFAIVADGDVSIDGVYEDRIATDGSEKKYTLSGNQITIRGKVTKLHCSNNQLTSLNLFYSSILEELECAGNLLTELDLSGCESLKRLSYTDGQLNSLNLFDCVSLTELDCSKNELTSLDLSDCTSLTSLACSKNKLESLDLSACTRLKNLECYRNKIRGKAVAQLVESLPDRYGKDPGKFYFVYYSDDENEENFCYRPAVGRANDKNWRPQKGHNDGSEDSWEDYFGVMDEGVVMMRTAQEVGSQITLTLEANGDVAIDGVKGVPVTDGKPHQYTLLSQDVTIRGYVTKLHCSGNKLTSLDLSTTVPLVELDCSNNQLTTLDVSHNAAVTSLACYRNQIKGEAMAQLIKGLPQLPLRSTHLFGIVSNAADEGNVFLKADVERVQDKGWSPMKWDEERHQYEPYAGKETETFAVTLTKEGEGTISATGATSLNAVAYGTELTIVATPAAGYKLTALTANGEDILATKKIVVTDNMTVKAIFDEATFVVSLKKEGEGTISATGADDLNAVDYGTELTIVATPAAGYKLTALTANGTDILATKKVVIKGATEVKATFADNTGVETTVTQQVKLYPNPATDYVIVEGVAPASEVTLHGLTGERLYAGRADDRGTLQIDLTPYADGVYLVCVAGETYRVVVRR